MAIDPVVEGDLTFEPEEDVEEFLPEVEEEASPPEEEDAFLS